LDLSIVTVSYNVSALLSACLSSVYQGLAQTSLATEVWVIDNASCDDSAAMVRRDFPQAHLLTNQENKGFAAATNQGLRQSQGCYLLLLNPDTQVLDEALATLVAFMEAHPAAGAAGARLLHADGSFQHSAFRFPTLSQIFLDFFPLHHRLLDSPLNGRYPRRLYAAGDPFPIDHPLGAAMMVRRETMAQVGMLDERFFMYCEEIDWAMRIRRAGWEIHCVPQARIIHHVGRSTQQFRDQMFVALWRSRYLLFAKHYGPTFRRLARILVYLGLRRERARLAHLGLSPAEMETRRRAFDTVWQIWAQEIR